MNIEWIVAILCIVAAAVLTVSILRGRHRTRIAQQKLDAPYNAWIKEAQQAYGYTRTLAELRNPPAGYERFPEAVKLVEGQAQARAHIAALDEADRQEQELCRATFEALRQEVDEQKQYEMLVTNRHSLFYRLEVDEQNWLKARLKELTKRRAEQLLERARGGDRDAFLELATLTTKGKSEYSKSSFMERTDEEYETPLDWDQLVTEFLTNPLLADFRFVRPIGDIKNGSVRLLASKAMRTRSIKLAKITLAYCNADRKIQLEVGDGRVTELSDFVEDFNAATIERTMSDMRSSTTRS